jgi:hypothetical protein
VRLLLLVFWLAVLPAFAEDPRVTSLISQGDSEEKLRHTKAALTALQQAEQLEPNNVGVLLRIAKQYSDLTSDAKSPAVAEQAALKSLEYSKRAVALDPTSAKAHLSVAVGYGKLTDFVSNKTKIEYSKSIKEFTEKSIALDASDDFAWHVLGRWHFGVANVGAVLKALARVVYGGLPPATNEEAARCLKKATELAPQKIIHRAALARVYKAMGKHELEVKEWQSILTLPALDKEDEQEKREAQQALASR